MLSEHLNSRRLGALAAAIVCFFMLGLSGCAIVPKPLEMSEKKILSKRTSKSFSGDRSL